MFNKILLFVSKTILVVALLNVVSWSVYYVHTGGDKLGRLTDPIREFSQFPDLVIDVLREVFSPVRLQKIDPKFEELNQLKEDVFALNAHFSNQEWTISLANLKNDSTIFNWTLKKKDFLSDGEVFSHSAPLLPILLQDYSLIIQNNETNNLFRLNKNSEILWHNHDFQFHHSINLDRSGNIWACTRELIQFPDRSVGYWDDHLTQIDVNTGEIIFHKSLVQILQENQMSYLIHGIANMVKAKGFDPLHLNDIEPVITDGSFWKSDDVLISVRHRSMIIHYRPATNKVIRTITGPFYNQHDVDIISDSTIAIFNNNISSLPKIEGLEENGLRDSEQLPNEHLNLISEVLIYNLRDSSFSSPYKERFEENEAYTATQGNYHLMSDGSLFVETQNDGKIFIFNENKTILKKYLNEPENGAIERPHWVRIYEDLDFLK